MTPKTFSPEKLDLIAAKSVPELREFLLSIPQPVRDHTLPRTPGFRKDSPVGLEHRLKQFINDLHGEGDGWRKARSVYPGLWKAWVSSRKHLNSALQGFDNSADFIDSKKVVPANSERDIAVFKFLSNASQRGQVAREEILAFYEFGYFLPDEQIERLIQEARPESDLSLLQRLDELPDRVSELRHEVSKLISDVEHEASQISQIRVDLSGHGQVTDQIRTIFTASMDRIQARMTILENNKTAANLLDECINLRRKVEEAGRESLALNKKIDQLSVTSTDLLRGCMGTHEAPAFASRRTRMKVIAA